MTIEASHAQALAVTLTAAMLPSGCGTKRLPTTALEVGLKVDAENRKWGRV